MTGINDRRVKGFSLIELVIVIVIIGIISAIAIPRLTRGANNAAATAAKGDLAVLRSAIEMYRAEHQGLYPTVAEIGIQLTSHTKIDGTDPNTNADVASGRVYGPYIRAIPALPVGARKGSKEIGPNDASGIGWIYSESTGDIFTNTTATELDQDGAYYNEY